MLRILALLITILALTACGGPAPAATPVPVAGTPVPTAPVVAAPTPAATLPPLTSLEIVFHKSGGIAGVNETTTIRADGTVVAGTQTRHASGGAQAATELARQIEATGLFAVKPARFMPADPCCDRFTYEVTLVRNGQSFVYATMDATTSAPAALFQVVGLIQRYIAAAS
jgi:hypothetical protein